MRWQAEDPGAPGHGAVRVRVEGCGVCASNLPLWEGRAWFQYPTAPGVPGHEAWGVVEAVGAGVSSAWNGRRVAMLAEDAFREAVVTPALEVEPVPESLADAPVPAEALGCAVNVFRRARVLRGMHVTVVGAGFLGLLLVQLCRRAGAHVAATSRRELPRELARRFGAERVLDGSDPGAVEAALGAWTQQRGCERVIEATGHAEPLALAARLCAVRGRLVVAGFHQDGLRSVDLQLWNWRGLDVINAHERDVAVRRRGMREALAALADGRLEAAPLYTHRFGFERLGEALDTLAQRPPDLVKALVVRSGGA